MLSVQAKPTQSRPNSSCLRNPFPVVTRVSTVLRKHIFQRQRQLPVRVLQDASLEAVQIEGEETLKELMDLEPKVEELMNPEVFTLTEDTSLSEAVKFFLDNKLSGAPVVDAEGKLVGVLSESDVMWKGAGTPEDHWVIPPIYLGFADAVVSLRDIKQYENEWHKILAKTVAEAMTRHPKSVQPSTPASEAANIMLHYKFTFLPVVEGEKLVGLITRSDILRGMVAGKLGLPL